MPATSWEDWVRILLGLNSVAVPVVYLTMLSLIVGYPGGLSEQTQPATR